MFEIEPSGGIFRHTNPSKLFAIVSISTTLFRISFQPHNPFGRLSVAAEIIEVHAGTMVDNDSNKQRRLVEFKDGCRYGKFGKTKAYELIAHDRIRAYKMGGKTLIDLDSVDEYHASLPRVETRVS
jgi:excisionase family DNA binding protein